MLARLNLIAWVAGIVALLIPEQASAMPAVAAAVAATAIGEAIAFQYGLSVFAAAALKGAISIGFSALIGSQSAPRQDTGDAGGFKSEAQDRQVVIRSAVEPRRVVYGQIPVSGPLLFATVTGSGASRTMHLVVPLADHEVEEIGTVWLGEDTIESADIGADGWVTGGKFYVESTAAAVKSAAAATTLVLDGTPAAVQSVVLSYTTTGDEGYVSSNQVSLAEVSGAPANAYQYSRSGATLTFHADITSFASGGITVNYTRTTGTPFVRIKKHLGASDQVADADLVAAAPSEWNSTRRGQGVAYLYIALVRSIDLFPQGVPNVKALVKGKKLYDPRTATTAWSDNSALVVYDYLRSTYGFGCEASEINSTLIQAAANVCDELVTVDAGGTTHKRYRTNGTVNTADKPLDVLRNLLTAMAGSCVYSVSTWDIRAGAYEAPTRTLTVDDLRGELQVQPRPSRQDLFNAVRGTYTDPGTWQATDFPPQTNANYEAQDGGQQIARDIELPYTTDAIDAQRIARIHLEKSRQGITVTWPGKLTCFRINTWETVALTVDDLGWTAKPFLVTGWAWNPQGGVDLTLQETASTDYDWNYGQATVLDPAPDSNLPAVNVPPSAPAAISVTEQQYETSGSTGVRSRAIVSWETPAGAFVNDYFLEYKAAAAAAYSRQRIAGETSVTLNDLAPGVYLFRVQSRNELGVLSAFSPVAVVEILGLRDIPADVENVNLIPLAGGAADITFDRHASLDVRIGGVILVRWSPSTTAPTWNDAVNVATVPGDARAARVAHLTGTYLVKARDSTGNESANAVRVITTEPDLFGFNAVDTVNCEPDWLGTKSNVVVRSDKLQLGARALIDDYLIPIDSWGPIDTLGGVDTDGTLDVDGYVDLGAVYTSRLTARVQTLSFRTTDTIDTWIEPIDSWGLIDGPEVSDTRCEVELATTDDNPAGSPTWSDWRVFTAGDYKARAFKFRVSLSSANAEHNIAVESLVITVDMPDREDGAREVTSGAGTYSVAYSLSPAFKALPRLAITGKNLATGDFFTVSNETVNGFDILFKSSAGTAVSRRFDWRAISY